MKRLFKLVGLAAVLVAGFMASIALASGNGKNWYTTTTQTCKTITEYVTTTVFNTTTQHVTTTTTTTLPGTTATVTTTLPGSTTTVVNEHTNTITMPAVTSTVTTPAVTTTLTTPGKVVTRTKTRTKIVYRVPPKFKKQLECYKGFGVWNYATNNCGFASNG